METYNDKEVFERMVHRGSSLLYNHLLGSNKESSSG